MAQPHGFGERQIETTQWADVQYKHGNKVGAYADPEKEQKILQQHINAEVDSVEDILNNEKQWSDMKRRVDEDDVREKSDEEEDEDEAEMRRMRERRMQQLQADAQKPQYGSIKTIARDNYTKEVNEAPKGVWVVLLLVAPESADCDFFANILGKIAAKHRFTKFVAGFAREVIGENFPEKQCPVVLFYKDGTAQKTVTGLEPWGGRKACTEQSVERGLRLEGVLPKEEES